MSNIYESIVSIMQKGYAIAKEKKNTQQGFKYRGIDDVMNTFQPLMAEAGIFLVPEVLEAIREERATKNGSNLIYSVLKIKYTFYASDGSHVETIVIGEGMDSGDKASNKAMAVAMKYAMFQTFCIPTEEMPDPDGFTPPESTPKAPAQTQTQNSDEMKFRCECCGKELQMYMGADGKPVSLRKHAEGSIKKFGRVLCINCIETFKSAPTNA